MALVVVNHALAMVVLCPVASCSQHDVRSSWGLPFPTSLQSLIAASPDLEGGDKSSVRVYQQTGLDPYRCVLCMILCLVGTEMLPLILYSVAFVTMCE